LLREIFSHNCINCKKKILLSSLFCDKCKTEFYEVSNICSGCGFPLDQSVNFCGHCYDKKDFDFIYVNYWYKSSIKTLLKTIKFKDNFKSCAYLKLLLYNKIKLLDFSQYDMITPVPSHFSRKMTRLFHPSDIAAKIISRGSSVPLVKALKRGRKTEYQWKLSKKARMNNVKESFLTVKDVLGLKILLVDDIYTSGATSKECAKQLKLSGADSVDLYIIAKGVF